MNRADAERIVAGGLWLACEPAAVRSAVLAAASLVPMARGARIYDAPGGPARLVGIA
ncbi:MAG: hypothetical protein ACK4Z0_07650 [Sphingomonadaceae bacterium]